MIERDISKSFHLSLCVLSWRARETLIRTLETYQDGGLLDCVDERILFFNEISDEDRAIADRFGFEALGTSDNLGIFGGLRALAQKARARYVLYLENDCPLITKPGEATSIIASAIGDMEAHDVPVFSVRSRREPGEKFDRRARYEKRFRVIHPLGAPAAAERTSMLRRIYEDFRKPRLIGCAIYAEELPDVRHPRAIRRTERGNWLTSSRYLNWSNNCLLARRDFLVDVVIPRVITHPAPKTINGHQDVEAALKLGDWWRKQNVPMGQSEPGAFTHRRLDR